MTSGAAWSACDRHYRGAWLSRGLSDREFLIIDGQQRMATLSILALAVIGKLRAMADRGVEPAPNRERPTSCESLHRREGSGFARREQQAVPQRDDNAFYQDTSSS